MPAIYISLKEAAELLGGVTTETVKNLLKRGTLKGHQEGTTWYVRKDSVEGLAEGFPSLKAQLDEIEGLKADIYMEKEQLAGQKKELNLQRRNRADDIALLHTLFDDSDRVAMPREALIETIGKVLGAGRTTEIVQRYLRAGCSINNMDDFGLTYERRRQLIQKGLNRFVQRLESYGALTEQRDKLIWEVDMLRKEKENLQKQLRQIQPSVRIGEEPPLILSAKINECGFSARTKNGLWAMGIRNVREMLTFSTEQLAKCRNFGAKSIQEVLDFCERNGLQLAVGDKD